MQVTCVFILPLNDDRYVGRTPYVIISLAIANGLVLAATYLLASSQLVFSRYGFTPVQPHILTMFSSLFLHAGIFHYLGNMFFLWMFGYRIENTFGRWLFVLVFLLCGCGATGLCGLVFHLRDFRGAWLCACPSSRPFRKGLRVAVALVARLPNRFRYRLPGCYRNLSTRCVFCIFPHFENKKLAPRLDGCLCRAGERQRGLTVPWRSPK